MKSTLDLQGVLFFPKTFQIFIGTIDNSVFSTISIVSEHYVFCALHDLNSMHGKEGCPLQASAYVHSFNKREMQGTCSNELKDVEHTL